MFWLLACARVELLLGRQLDASVDKDFSGSGPAVVVGTLDWNDFGAGGSDFQTKEPAVILSTNYDNNILAVRERLSSNLVTEVEAQWRSF